jgi:hypothetical protein
VWPQIGFLSYITPPFLLALLVPFLTCSWQYPGIMFLLLSVFIAVAFGQATITNSRLIYDLTGTGLTSCPTFAASAFPLSTSLGLTALTPQSAPGPVLTAGRNYCFEWGFEVTGQATTSSLTLAPVSVQSSSGGSIPVIAANFNPSGQAQIAGNACAQNIPGCTYASGIGIGTLDNYRYTFTPATDCAGVQSVLVTKIGTTSDNFNSPTRPFQVSSFLFFCLGANVLPRDGRRSPRQFVRLSKGVVFWP